MVYQSKGCWSGIDKNNASYLPPLNSLITDFGTVYKIFEIIQNHAKKMNMPDFHYMKEVFAIIGKLMPVFVHLVA